MLPFALALFALSTVVGIGLLSFARIAHPVPRAAIAVSTVLAFGSLTINLPTLLALLPI